MSRRRGIAAFPFISENPYQRLLYAALAEQGFTLAADAHFRLGWLVRARRRVAVLHFHWPQDYYSWWRRPAALRGPLSWLKLAVFATRLGLARALGYRIVWTVHQVYPHDRFAGTVDKMATALLARACAVLIAHDDGTAVSVARELGRAADRLQVIDHGSYVGVYPAGRPRDEVRGERGIASHSFALLCFGHVRAYKDIDLLLEGFRSARLEDAALVVAGLPLDAATADAVSRAADEDPRIVPMLEFVPDDQVAELYGAVDAAVVTRTDGGTSGSLILALSLGVPVVASDLPEYARLLDDGQAGWLFRAGDPESLARTLERAAGDPSDARRKGAHARATAERLDWKVVGERTAQLLLGRAG